MNEKARQRLIDGINRMAGRADCEEAVVLQQRNPLMTAVLFVAVFAIGVGLQAVAQLGGLILGGLVGLMIGVGMVLTTDTYWLGRCTNDVVLVTTNTMQSRPEAVVSILPMPVQATVGSGLLSKKVTYAGDTYLVAVAQLKRFRNVVGLPPA